jgi:tetratricopeptide (TPR) repeat protein
MSLSPALLLAGLILTTPRLAFSQTTNDEARRGAAELFRAGQAAFDRGDHQAAARAFEQAHARVPSGQALYNAARAWDAAGQESKSASAYAAAMLRSDLPEAPRAHVEERLSELRRRLGEIDVSGVEGTRLEVAGLEPRDVPTLVLLPPGRHTLVFVAGDGPKRRVTIEIGAGERLEIREPDVEKERATSLAAVAPAQQASAARPWLAWSGVAVAGVAGAAAVVLGLNTRTALDDFEDSGNTDRDAHDRAVDLRLGTNVAIGVATMGAVVAVLGFWRPWRTEAGATATRDSRWGFVLGPRAVALGGSF